MKKTNKKTQKPSAQREEEILVSSIVLCTCLCFKESWLESVMIAICSWRWVGITQLFMCFPSNIGHRKDNALLFGELPVTCFVYEQWVSHYINVLSHIPQLLQEKLTIDLKSVKYSWWIFYNQNIVVLFNENHSSAISERNWLL